MDQGLHQFADDLFRRESARLVSQLTVAFGPEHLQLAEDVVQEAIGKALRTWPFVGIPENPGGWLATCAKNLALDVLRREQIVRKKQVDMFGSRHSWSSEVNETDLDAMDSGIDDALLRMMFVCCHPTNPPPARLALTLKTLCGLGVAEIASALLSSEVAVARRLTRAKENLRAAMVTTELGGLKGLDERLDAVLTALYLLFNEGYQASTGDRPLKADLCADAIRLSEILVATSIGDRPKTHALLALMLFHQARLQSRIDEGGALLLLSDQKRSQWDAGLILRGSEELKKAAVGTELDRFHIEATIAAVHCTSASFEETDWSKIAALYDILLSISPTPPVLMNRAVAIGFAEGPERGLEALAAIGPELDDSPLLHSIRGEFLRRSGDSAAARPHFQHALQLANVTWQRSLIESQMLKLTI